MVDANKAREIARRIEDISRAMGNHASRISRLEREKNDRMKYYDQQITREQDEIKRCQRQIDDLKRQL